jgi:hypothetical protein
MELVATTEWQTSSNLPGVMPAPIAKRFENQKFQFATLPHKRILPVFVSTLLWMTETYKKASRMRQTAKASTLRTLSRANLFLIVPFYFPWERSVSNVQKI